MTRDDDDDWLDTLAGRGHPGTAAATELEAQWLRAAQRREAALQREAAEAVNPAAGGLERLLARAAEEGLADRPAHGRRWCRGCAARWRDWRARLAAAGTHGRVAGAAVALSLVMGIWTLLPIGQAPGDAPVLRDAPGAVLVLIDAQPALRRDRLAATLQVAGVAVRRYERLGRYGLDAELPWPLPAALGEALVAQGLALPAQPVLRVEFAPPAPPPP